MACSFSPRVFTRATYSEIAPIVDGWERGRLGRFVRVAEPGRPGWPRSHSASPRPELPSTSPAAALGEADDLGEGFDLLRVAGHRVEQQVGGALRGQRFQLLADLLRRAVD